MRPSGEAPGGRISDLPRPAGEALFRHPFPFRAFLSHSSGDRAVATALKERLEAVGVELYLAEHDLQPGRLLSAKVQQAIERSHCVVVLLTPAAADSAFVQQEIGYAIKCERPVIRLVDPSVPHAKLGMLEGHEYIHLDPTNPDQAISDAERYLTTLKDKKEWRDLGVAVIVIGALVVLSSGGDGASGTLSA